MKRTPFFSIVIPTFNRAKDLEFALFCLFRQSFSDFEIIISDNASTDETKLIVAGFRDIRIKYFRNRTNISFIPNIDRAIKLASGKYIFLHGDDDFLLHEKSLMEIYKEVRKHKPGYIRVNYLCFTPDKKSLFDFKIGKPLLRNKFFPPFSNNKKIISFIFDTDSSFLSGVIFKNSLPKNISIIDSGVIPWINILFYSLEKYGGYFISTPHIIGSWSQWILKKNEPHPLYKLIDGKLVYENYLNLIKSKLDSQSFKIFLRNRLMKSYVQIFPAIKVYVGNKNLMQIVARLRVVDPDLDKSIIFWIYLIPAYIFPRWFLALVKDKYFQLYVRFFRVQDERIWEKLGKLKQEYREFKQEKIR